MSAKHGAPRSARLPHDLPPSVCFTLADGTALTAEVRPSARARRARLTLSLRGVLTLTAPLTMPPAQLARSLPRFLPWLERAWKKDRDRKPETPVPRRIVLPLAESVYRVETAGTMAEGCLAAASLAGGACLPFTGKGARRLLVVESPGLLRLFGALDDASLCADALRHWCRNAATRLLPPYLEALALRGGFALAGVSVRDQSSRWGSCARLRPDKNSPAAPSGLWGRWTTRAPGLPADRQSTAPAEGLCRAEPQTAGPAGRINLNWRALLLPTPLLEHLCWHELCHLRHMNHSPAYRAELALYSPFWPEREKALNRAWRELPWWALPGEEAWA